MKFVRKISTDCVRHLLQCRNNPYISTSVGIILTRVGAIPTLAGIIPTFYVMCTGIFLAKFNSVGIFPTKFLNVSLHV